MHGLLIRNTSTRHGEIRPNGHIYWWVKLNKNKCTAMLTVLALAFILIPAAQARAINKIRVIVRDSTGNPVEEAKVSVTRIEGGYDQLWRTNASGAWTFVNAPAGNYVINARFLKGRFEVGEVEVYVDGDVTVDVSLSTPEEMVIIEDIYHETRFVVSELTIKPAVVEFNETVDISVVLNNIGERVGTYNITLYVYGPFLYNPPSNMFGMSGRQVKGGDFEVDSESFTPQESYCAEGTYNVTLGGLKGSFKVVSGEVHEAKPVGGGRVNLLPQAIIVSLILLIGFFLLLRFALHRWIRYDDRQLAERPRER